MQCHGHFQPVLCDFMSVLNQKTFCAYITGLSSSNKTVRDGKFTVLKCNSRAK